MIEEIKKTCEVLQAGGIILYPTDTVWGIGCDATNEEAVKKVYDLKRRKMRGNSVREVAGTHGNISFRDVLLFHQEE